MRDIVGLLPGDGTRLQSRYQEVGVLGALRIVYLSLYVSCGSSYRQPTHSILFTLPTLGSSAWGKEFSSETAHGSGLFYWAILSILVEMYLLEGDGLLLPLVMT